MKSIVERIGKAASWLSLIIVCLICFDVFFRYIFNWTQIWLVELEWYLFGALFLLCGAWSFMEDRHVRVDVFYTQYSIKIKKWVNRIGHIFLTLPWVLVILYASFEYAGYSLRWNESSPDPGGLPARYLIKYCIFFGFVLMLIATISLLISRDDSNLSE